MTAPTREQNQIPLTTNQEVQGQRPQRPDRRRVRGQCKKAKIQLRYENAKQAILEHNGSTALSTKYADIAEFELVVRIRERLGR